MARFTVVVPAYNAQDTLEETLDAVLAQTWKDFELVVVDDGSSDNTRQIAEGYAQRDTRIRVMSQENRGSAGAYNTGAAAATGDYITICSADDVLLPCHLQTMNALIDTHPDGDIFSSNGYWWYPDGTQEVVYGSAQDSRWATEHQEELSDVIQACFFSVGATYQRSWFDKVGGYRLGIYAEDYDFWLRAMCAGAQHWYRPDVLAKHRLSDTQKSAATGRMVVSNVKILSDLVESGCLGENEKETAQQVITELEKRVPYGGMTLDDAAATRDARQAQRLRAIVSRIVGEPRTDAWMDHIHKVTRLVRPLRRAVNRARTRMNAGK